MSAGGRAFLTLSGYDGWRLTSERVHDRRAIQKSTAESLLEALR